MALGDLVELQKIAPAFDLDVGDMIGRSHLGGGDVGHDRPGRNQAAGQGINPQTGQIRLFEMLDQPGGGGSFVEKLPAQELDVNPAARPQPGLGGQVVEPAVFPK